ncbi:ligand-binding sensor domain-containing protein [Bryocella elongata]|uniref:ligand-binding sensor domain-containing protein n=1 Tax=Bryocella elongata TaxID=863522 RepID=UPI00135B3D35|nr:sensor histidine kinase [Bryocella elongata]
MILAPSKLGVARMTRDKEEFVEVIRSGLGRLGGKLQSSGGPSAWVLLILVLFAGSSVSFGASQVPPSQPAGSSPQAVPEPAISESTHTFWSRRDGAPGGISSLAQTRDGYLWIGSTLGLYRFDGLHFASFPFNASDPPMPSLYVSSVAADLDGGLWVSFRNPAILHLCADGTRVTYLPRDGLIADMMDKVIPRPDGRVFAFGGGKLFQLVGSRWVNFGGNHGLSASGGVFSVFFDRDDNIWIGRDKKLVVLRKGAERFEEAPVPVHYVSSMVQSRKGELWIADAWRSIRPISDVSSKGVLALNSRAEMMVDSKDNLWVAQADQGLSRIMSISSDTPVHKVEHAVPDEISAMGTNALLEDREGNIWLGTDRGLDRFQQTTFTKFRGVSMQYFPSLVATDDGAVWINSRGSPLMRVKDGVTTFVGGPVNTGPLAKMRSGDLCFVDATRYVLQCYGSAGFKETPLDPIMDHVPPLSMTADSDDTLLASFIGKGLWRYHDAHWDRVTDKAVPNDSDAWGMLVDSSGRLWLGYNDHQIVERHDGRYETIPIEGGPWSNTITFYEAANTIWAGGAHGLCFLHDGRMIVVHPFEADLFRGTSGIVEDRGGNLWLNAAAGALRIPASEVRQLLLQPDHLTKADVFDDNDGLTGQPTQSKRTPSAIVDKSGVLWLATAGGVFSLDPSKALQPRSAPIVLLESVSINGVDAVPARGPSGMVVTASSTDFHELAISYIGIQLSAPERVYYRYRLIGESNAWEDAGQRRQAFYTHLRPGTYRFEVSASNGREWSTLAIPLLIQVPPAFYQTSWFFLFCIGAVAALLWIAYRIRVNFLCRQVSMRINAQTSERLNVSRDLHDTLLQGMQGLILSFHALSENPSLADDVRGTILAVGDRAEAVLEEGREKIRALRFESLTNRSLVREIERFSERFLGEDLADFELVVTGHERDLAPLVYEEICFICREAISNAFRHAQASKVEVLLSYTRSRLKVIVRDDGIGIDERDMLSGPAGHWGVVGMRERAERIGGRIDIRNVFPERHHRGTEVSAEIAATVAYARSDA